MSENEKVINAAELQILLNKFDSYELTFPIFSDFQLLKAISEKDGYKTTINNINFDQFYTDINKLESEYPDFNDFRECFLSSGCISYTNAVEFEKKYEFYNNMHKKVYFALDTNILYHRYISSSPLLKDNKVIIAPTIKEEIEASMNYKYSPNQITELKDEVKFNKNLIDELNNGRMKRSRKAAYFAMHELKNINSIEAENINFDANGYEKNDLKIIKELKNFETKTGALIIVLTSDRMMIDCCGSQNMEYFLFNYPPSINVSHIMAKKFRNLIFNFATLFGFIKLNSVIIFGEFRGKNQLEQLKCRFLNKEIFNEFEKDLNICRKLMSLGIDF